MFDEEPKDIFAGTDNSTSQIPPTVSPPSGLIAPPPTNLPPSYAAVPPTNAPGIQDSPSHHVRHMKTIMLLTSGLVLLGVSGFFAYRIMVQPAEPSGVVDSVSDSGVMADDDLNVTDDNLPEDEPLSIPVETANPATLLDSDGDGLTNARELEVGTSVTKADTDGDGLGDKEEVEVYGTDPRKADTDGDGYLDGQEVSGGYNPNGEGKLFTVPTGS